MPTRIEPKKAFMHTLRYAGTILLSWVLSFAGVLIIANLTNWAVGGDVDNNISVRLIAIGAFVAIGVAALSPIMAPSQITGNIIAFSIQGYVYARAITLGVGIYGWWSAMTISMIVTMVIGSGLTGYLTYRAWEKWRCEVWEERKKGKEIAASIRALNTNDPEEPSVPHT